MAGTAPFANVLLILDGSDTSLRAAEYAVHLCSFAEAHLIAIAVVDTATLHHLLSTRIMVHSETKEFEAELQSSAEAQLRRVTHLAGRSSIRLDTMLIRGSMHGAVFEESQRLKPDLVVMGGYTSSIVKRDFSAYERQRVADELLIPILLVR